MKNIKEKITVFGLMLLLLLVFNGTILAADPPIVGKWGYTLLGKGQSGCWYGWKEEAGTITFNSNGTGMNEFAESADTCPDLNFCKSSETNNFTYTVYQNQDGTYTLTMTFPGNTAVVKIALSDDNKVFVTDGTTMPDTCSEMMMVGIKMDTSKTYTDADVAGQYFAGAYEYDALDGNKGKYRLWSLISAMNNGTVVNNGTLNGDGTIIPVTNQQRTYIVNSDGSLLMNGGVMKGYAGYGNALIFSNAIGGVATDFSSFIALRKQDRSYIQTDLQGTWVMSGFGDYTGTLFRSEFGIVTCDATGNCAGSFRRKSSDGTTVTVNHTIPKLTVSNDGSLNGFLLPLANTKPWFSGAIGNDGKTALLVMNPSNETTNDRELVIAVKCSTCTIQPDPTISVTGMVQDPSGNYVSGIKVEKADNPLIYTFTNSGGSFTLPGIPSGQDFTLRFTMNGALPTYTPIYNYTANTTLTGYYRLYPPGWNANMGNTPGKGIIHSRIRESGANWETSFLSGVTVSASGGYTVEYKADGLPFGGSSTFGNGQWFVRNANPGDVITALATKDGTDIPSRRYMAFADGVTTGALFATANPGTIWVTGKAVDFSNGQDMGGVTAELFSYPATNTTTNTDGSFTITRIPASQAFTLKFSKANYAPSYLGFGPLTTNVFGFVRPARLVTSLTYASWSVQSGKGVLFGTVRDSANPFILNISGAVVTAGSYVVTYQDASGNFGGTSTYSNGRFYAFNITDGETVMINAAKSGYTFSSSSVTGYAGGMTLTPVTGAQTTSATIPLTTGWNLISTPIQPSNTAIGTVLNGISGSYSIVWAYMNGVWKLYDPSDPEGSTLTEFLPGYGYWIKTTQAVTWSQ